MTGYEHPAAKVVREANHGGFDDWFLPSKDELYQMYVNLGSQGVGDFADDFYWSSSEDSSDGAWLQIFPYVYQYNYPKPYSRLVQAF